MLLLIGALAALVVGVATLGSATTAIVAGVFATTVSHLVLPMLAPGFADLWLPATATLALGGLEGPSLRKRTVRNENTGEILPISGEKG